MNNIGLIIDIVLVGIVILFAIFNSFYYFFNVRTINKIFYETFKIKA